jgi:hypothetical protein
LTEIFSALADLYAIRAWQVFTSNGLSGFLKPPFPIPSFVKRRRSVAQWIREINRTSRPSVVPHAPHDSEHLRNDLLFARQRLIKVALAIE